MERWTFYAEAIHDFRAKKECERNVFPHAITVFVDNRRLKVATRLIIKCSGSWTIGVFNHPAESPCRKRPVSPNCRRQDGGFPS